MKKCWLILFLCFLLAGCSTYKPKPKGFSELSGKSDMYLTLYFGKK
ncbi:hypothetical protein P4U97_19725 [Bacillus swezeyi]|nr:hypothetical protein [Bacillus swezeyi]